MKLADYLKEERIILDLEVGDKEDAINKMVDYLSSSTEILDLGAFKKDVFERESLYTTGIGDGVALPHARSKSVNSFAVVFARVSDGIDFKSIDSKPVKLIFLMATPKDRELKSYLRILAHMSRLLKDDSFKELLLGAQSSEDIIKVFKDAED